MHGTRIELPYSAQRLITFLALHHPRPLVRVFVAGNLWAESSEPQANSSLRSVLWRLRSASPVVSATSRQLALEPWVEVDVAHSARLAQRVLEDEGAPDLADLRAISTAGDLLPDWYDDWLIVERERVRQRRLHCLEAACRRLTAHGRYAEALEVGLAVLAIEPLRETSHLAVMRAHLAEGNLIEASRQYEVLRDLLRRHLGTVPSPAARALLRG
jgi:DNA-binding SARP family transcriptional activator